MSRIFVSYSRTDSPFAHDLRDALVQGGHEVWLDIDEIEPADDWLASIEHALASSSAVVFVVSPSSLRSEFCMHELRLAAAQKKRIIAITLDGADNKLWPDELRDTESIYAGDGTDLAAVLVSLDQTA